LLEILRISVLWNFDGADFWLTATKPQSTLYGLTRILTKGRLKYARQNHDSDYYCQAQHEGKWGDPFALHFVIGDLQIQSILGILQFSLAVKRNLLMRN